MMSKKPSDMPHRIVRAVRTDLAKHELRLNGLADEAIHLMEMFVSAGYTEDTALELTSLTLERYDEVESPGW